MQNIAGHLGEALPVIQWRQLEVFRKVDNEIADRVSAAIQDRQKSNAPRTLIA